MPCQLEMGMIGEDRPKVVGNAIPFEDALRVFQDWQSRSIPIQVSFLSASGFGDAIRATIDGLVTVVDPQGIVVVSGDGREIKLDLRGNELFYVNSHAGHHDNGHSLESDSTLQVTFPKGAVCNVTPGSRASDAPDSEPPAFGFQWLRNKLRDSGARRNTLKGSPVGLSAAKPAVRRELLVDVRHGQANIVEVVETRNGPGRIRRLKEQFLSKADGMRAERLKRQIIYGENGGAYELSGMYRPKTESSILDLRQLVEELERQDDSWAWDRRRFLR